MREDGTSLYIGMPDGEINENLIQAQATATQDPHDIALVPCDFLHDYPIDLFMDADTDFVDDRADFSLYHVIGYPVRRGAMNLHDAAKTVRPKPFLYTGTRIPQDGSPAHLHLHIDAMKARHGNQRW
jgi:hypothetical protein